MTREQAKAMLPIIQAFAEGKTIQYKDKYDKWLDVAHEETLGFEEKPFKYRIKPEPKYRPFKDKEECWSEMLKHQPFGWIKDEYKHVHITCVYKSSIECSPDTDDYDVLHSCIISFNNVLEQGYTFADGTPFGIKEE